MLASCTKENPQEADISELHNIIAQHGGASGIQHFILPNDGDWGAIPQDPNNPITTAKVELGKLLFHETALSNRAKYSVGNGTFSCASCHHAQAQFQSGLAQGVADGGIGFGTEGEGRSIHPLYSSKTCDVQAIKSPTTLNSAFQTNQLWNGQFGATDLNVGTEHLWTEGTPKAKNQLGFEGVETQAIAGLEVHRMLLDKSFVEEYPEYKDRFDQVFADTPEGERYSNLTAGLAIAAYERTLLSNQAPFQQWLKGNENALNEQELQGAKLFFGKAGCVSCHTGPGLNSMAFHAIGMEDLQQERAFHVEYSAAEHLGRGGFTGHQNDMYKFKVPQLYNLKESKFFGHGSSMNSLAEVVEYKNAGVKENSRVIDSQLASEFRPLNLTDSEMADLTAFLEDGLYDPQIERFVPDDIPSGLCFPNNDTLSASDQGCD